MQIRFIEQGCGKEPLAIRAAIFRISNKFFAPRALTVLPLIILVQFLFSTASETRFLSLDLNLLENLVKLAFVIGETYFAAIAHHAHLVVAIALPAAPIGLKLSLILFFIHECTLRLLLRSFFTLTVTD